MTPESPTTGGPLGAEADPVDEMIVQCLREPPAMRDAVLAGLCSRHPSHAAALRARYAFLLEAGLIEGPGALAATLPDRVGGFRVLRRLGQGGMGVVYLAEQESLGRRVALKVIQPGAAAPPRARERFRREVQAVSLLDHPNICQVYDAGEVEGVPYLAMRYVEGETLAERIARESAAGGAQATPAGDAASVDRLVAMGEQLARALHAAHEKGLVHRDVKPGNVMLEATTGRPLLLDFGLARLDDPGTPTLTLSGDRLGTPAYMAPEQVAGLPADRRTDVYALGATLYEALTGLVPHRAPTRETLYRRILGGEITLASRHNPRVPRDLAVVLATALDRDPDRRYRTAADFADDLQRVRRRQPILARPPGLWLRARRWCQRNPSAATVLGVLGTGLATSIWLLQARAAALAERDVALKVRMVFDFLAEDPRTALERAWEAVQLDPSPDAMMALRAAVHAPQVEASFALAHKADTAFACWPGGPGPADDLLAWCDALDRRLWVWRRGEAVEVARIPGSEGFVPGLAFSPDGRLLAVAGFDAPCTVYELEGRLRHLLRPPEDWRPEMRSLAVAWHPGGDRLVVGAGESWIDHNDCRFEVLLYRLDAAQPAAAWRTPVGAWPLLLRFLDDATLVVAPGANRVASRATFRDHDVLALRVADGSIWRRHERHAQPCMEMAVSGSLIATTGHDGKLVLWDLDRDHTEVRQHPLPVFTVDFAPDGQSLATACEDGVVRVFDRQGTELHRWSPHGTTIVEAAVFHPDGDKLLVNHHRGRELRTVDGRLLARLPRGSAVVRIDHFLGRNRLVTVDRYRLRVWRLEPEGLRTTTFPAGQVPLISPNGERLVTASADGMLRALDPDGGERWAKPMPPTRLQLDDEGRVYQVTADRRLLIRGPDGELEPAPEQWRRPIWRLGCAPRGALVAASGNGRNVRVVRRGPDGVWKTVVDVGLPQLEGLDRVVQSRFRWLRGPGDSWRILAGTWRGLVEYELAGDRLELVDDHLEDEVVQALAVAPGEQVIAAHLGSRGLCILERVGWSWRERGRDPEFRGTQISFAGPDRLMVTTGEEIRVYDLDFGLIGRILNLDEVGLAYARRLPGSDKIVTIAANNVMREWWIDDARVLTEARRLLGR